MRNAIPGAIIAQIQALGFDVYMRTPADSWLYFARGSDIGYLQHDCYSGYSLSTVHRPNQTTGTGFDMGRALDDSQIDKDALEACFVVAPSWVRAAERKTVVKYPSMAAFISADQFNKGYKLVERQANDNDAQRDV